MGFFGMGNMSRLTAFWAANTDHTIGQKTGWKKAVSPKQGGQSRKQTESITFLFEGKGTMVTVKMANGELKRFACGVFNPSKASDVGKEFALILDGEKIRAEVIATELKKAKVGDTVVLTHESVTLVPTEPEEEESTNDTPGKPRIGIRRVGRIKKS